MFKQTVNKNLNYLLKLFFLLYLSFFFEETAWMKSSNLNKNNPNIDSEESWCDYLNENKYKILGGSLIVLTIILIINNYPPSNGHPEIEILKDLEMIKNHLPEGQYEMILDLVEEMYSDFGEDPVEVVQYAIIDFLNEFKERGKNLYISDELKNYFEKED
jgi:hypothetical protein